MATAYLLCAGSTLAPGNVRNKNEPPGPGSLLFRPSCLRACAGKMNAVLIYRGHTPLHRMMLTKDAKFLKIFTSIRRGGLVSY